MASNQEQVNGEDFSQDVNASEDEHVNGGGDQSGAGEKQNGDGAAANPMGNSEVSGRDDDRYADRYFFLR